MSGFYIPDFAGMVPRTSPRLIAPNQAQNALNAKLWSGELRCFKDLSTVVTPSIVGTKKSIYRFGQDGTDEAQYWFHRLVDIDWARGPINNDTSERTYWTGESEPRVTDSSIALAAGTDYPMAHYKLGIPKPANTPTLATDGAGSGDPKSMAAVYTYVSGWGEEGPPSDPSDIENIMYGDEITVGNMSTSPGSGYNITAKRIYLAISGSTGTDYQFFAEIALATSSSAATITAISLGEVIRSKTWIAPPSGMLGLHAMGGNGVMAGFLNNDVWLCEPYLPHAWPARYRKSMPFGVVGLGSFDSMLVVLTKGAPYAGSVPHSSQFVPQKVGGGRACVAKRGIVSYPFGVVYPSTEGLGIIGPGGYELLTEPYFTEDEWEAIAPSSLHAYALGNRYFGFYTDGGTSRGFIFNPRDPRSGFIYVDTYATAGYVDPLRKNLYLQVGDDIKKWDSTSTKSYTWKSKVFTMPKPINPAVAQVIATSYPVTLKLYADGTLKHTATVASGEPFSLPTGYKARDFEVQLEGTASVRGVAVAETIQELRGLIT